LLLELLLLVFDNSISDSIHQHVVELSYDSKRQRKNLSIDHQISIRTHTETEAFNATPPLNIAVVASCNESRDSVLVNANLEEET
jgi:hypothetical protein